MAYNSNLLNLYTAGLYETFCITRHDTSCYLFDFHFEKDGQSPRVFDLIMENL